MHLQLMLQESLQDFLTQQQKVLLNNTLNEIKGKLKKMPVKTMLILAESRSANIKYLSQIDPEGGIIIAKLAALNEEAIINLFHSTCQPIIKIISQNINTYLDKRTLRFLKPQISKEVNQVCGSTEFSLRIEHAHVKVGNSLWQSMHEQLIEVAMGIYGFMHYYFEMVVNQEKRDMQVQQYLQAFRAQFDGKAKLSSVYVLSQRLDEEMKQKMKQSILFGDVQEDEWTQIINEIDEMEKEEEQKQEQQKIVSERSHEEKDKGKNIFGLIKGTAQKAFKSVKNIVSNSSYQQKSISSIQLAQHLQHYLQNLQSFHDLSDPQKQFILKTAELSMKQIEYQLQGEFDLRQLSIIRYAINQPTKCLENSIGEQTDLLNSCTCVLISYSQQLEKALERLHEGGKQQPNGQLLLAAFFYKALQADYSPFTKRYLTKVFRVIQKQFTRDHPLYIRGALRYLQVTTIKSTKQAQLLSNLKPQRSKGFEQSNKSILYMQKCVFQDENIVNQMVNRCLKDIRVENGFKQVEPEIQLIRLNSSSQSKTVTIAISGFLSQDTSKDLEWLGLIRALENTQLYALGWKSSTVKQIGAYIGSKAINVALNPINLTGANGILLNVLNLGVNILNQVKNNPFTLAHQRAASVGLYLAEVIHKVFPDRFINLVGFSLGTEVVSCCLKRLAEKGRLGLINRVITLGGVAMQETIKHILEKSSSSIQMINLWSEKDYAVRYMYRICRLGTMPLGAGDLGPVSGHQITSINSTKFIRSHMQFRSNLYGIGLLTGLVHD